MIEGGGSKDFRVAKQFLYNHPALRLLLERLADAVTEYLQHRSKLALRPCKFLTPGAGS